MKFRHEWKHEINLSDMKAISQRMSVIAKPEEHGINGIYNIRSLYFDNADDTALRDKINGVNKRQKFRIRYYNNDTSFIKLEKKSKINGLCNKVYEVITLNEAKRIANHDIAFMRDNERALLRELYYEMQTNGLKIKTVVDYTRQAFVFAPGNVRVTLDYNIRTSLALNNLWHRDSGTVPIGNAPIILEVKWDEYLPDIIRDSVFLPGRRSTAFSKYAMCRIYG